MRVLLRLVATLCSVFVAAEQCSAMSTTRKVPFTLLGAGGVGAALLKAIVGARELHENAYGLRLCAKAVCDSSAVATGDGGELSDEAIASILEHKAGGGKLADLVLAGVTITAKPVDASASAFLAGLAVDDGGLLVDCTATEDTVPALLATAAGGSRVVAANKKPFSSAYSTFQALSSKPARTKRTPHLPVAGARHASIRHVSASSVRIECARMPSSPYAPAHCRRWSAAPLRPPRCGSRPLWARGCL